MRRSENRGEESGQLERASWACAVRSLGCLGGTQPMAEEGQVGSLPPLLSCLSLLRRPASDTPGPGHRSLRPDCFR